jgi:elongation factor G
VTIKALVPFAEMLSYANELISMTQGRGSYSMEFSHYDFVPAEIADKVIAAHKPHHSEDDESEVAQHHSHSSKAHSA